MNVHLDPIIANPTAEMNPEVYKKLREIFFGIMKKFEQLLVASESDPDQQAVILAKAVDFVLFNYDRPESFPPELRGAKKSELPSRVIDFLRARSILSRVFPRMIDQAFWDVHAPIQNTEKIKEEAEKIDDEGMHESSFDYRLSQAMENFFPQLSTPEKIAYFQRIVSRLIQDIQEADKLIDPSQQDSKNNRYLKSYQKTLARKAWTIILKYGAGNASGADVESWKRFLAEFLPEKDLQEITRRHKLGNR